MRLTILGSGNASGVPVYGCDCRACRRAHADDRYRRRACFALLEAEQERGLIDAGLSDLGQRFPNGSCGELPATVGPARDGLVAEV